jgi:hypothetical protein
MTYQGVDKLYKGCHFRFWDMPDRHFKFVEIRNFNGWPELIAKEYWRSDQELISTWDLRSDSNNKIVIE